MINNDIFFSMLKGFAIILAFGFIYLITAYIVTSISFQRMANKLNLENSFLAWIPIANLYLLGRIIGDEIDFLEYKIKDMSIILPLISTFSYFLYNIPYIGFIFAILIFLINVMVFYKVASIFKPKSATLYTLLSIFLGLLTPFLYLSLSMSDLNNND